MLRLMRTLRNRSWIRELTWNKGRRCNLQWEKSQGYHIHNLLAQSLHLVIPPQLLPSQISKRDILKKQLSTYPKLIAPSERPLSFFNGQITKLIPTLTESDCH